MRLIEHVRELRRRVLLTLVGLAVGAVPAWFLYPVVFDAIQAPVVALNDSQLDAALIFTSPAAAFDMRVRVTLWLATFLASPWWLYQLWAFIRPGLRRGEKRRATAFVAAAVPLFFLGAALAWTVLPNAVAVLATFAPEGALSYMPATDYLRFVMRVVMAFGIAFLVPLVMVVLNAMGMVTGRALLGGWRWAILATFAFGALASPTPDAYTMTAIALPTLGLYFGAVGIAVRRDKRAATAAAREPV